MAIAQSSSPLGVDHFGRPFDWVNDPGRPEDMTSEEFDKWTSMYYDDTPAPSSPGKSPDSRRPSTHVNQVTSSPSSEDGHLEFTPSSTALDSLNDVGNVDDADLISAYTTSPSEDYEFITPFSSRSSDYLHVAQPASHVSDATIASAYRPSASPGDFLPVPSPQQWSSFTTTNSDGSDLALQQESVAQYGFDNNTSTPSSGFHADFSANTTLPLRPMPSSQPPPAAHTQSFPIYGTSWGNVQQSFTYQEHQSNALTTPQTPLYMNHNYVYQPAIIQLPTAAVSFSGLPSSDQRRMDLTQPTTIPVQPPLMNSPANCGADGHTPRAQLKLFQSPRKRTLHHAAVKAEQSRTLVPRQGPRPIAAAGLPNGVPLQEAPDTKQPRGGRKKHSHLTEQARKRSSVMRKKGACWRCRLQRDPCPDDGTPCARCLHVITSQKGQQYFFACDRSKLPDFVLDFLPPSFTTMHSKQNIEDCVQDQVQIWDHTRPVEVFLTSGYGPPLRWILHEFQPATMELMAQFQYLQNPHTRQSVRHEKWSPPLGVMRLEPSDDWHFKNYLDELMTDEHLIHFPWRCFEEESQIDDFQAELLALMCRLYQATNDIDLQFLLQKLIRMMIITYIMAHTLTITEDSLLGIHAFVRNPNKPTQPQPYTSPRLANRQLKFFFHMLRQQIFDEILKWQQATLCASSGKDSTWLSSFVVILTFAMVLEEIQRTMHIQADAKARKRECSFDAAQQEARNACERIDDRFGLLVGLFQCKYRDKKWNQKGSFGAQTPRLRDADEHLFCKDVRDLLEEKRDLLTDRKAVPFAFQNQCYYTSRLVARFLLPFLDLPA